MLHELQKMNYPAVLPADPNILQEPGGEYELFITRPRAPDSRGWHERSDPSFITAMFYDSHIRSNLILFH